MSLCLAAPFVMRTRGAGAVARPFHFYLVAALITWLLALGPTIRFMGGSTGIDGPFVWLLALPGATGLRVPARFWLMTVLCLTTVAGIVVAELLRGRRFVTRATVIAAAALAVLGDGWVDGIRTEPMPRLGPVPAGTGGPGRTRAAFWRPCGGRRRAMAGGHRRLDVGERLQQLQTGALRVIARRPRAARRRDPHGPAQTRDAVHRRALEQRLRLACMADHYIRRRVARRRSLRARLVPADEIAG